MKVRAGRILTRLAGKEESVRPWSQALSISATLGWMAVILYFLGSPDPPSPDAAPWWFPRIKLEFRRRRQPLLRGFLSG